MENKSKFNRAILTVALITVFILMVPLIAMQFTSEVDWKLPDFLIMGGLIFGTGFSFVWLTRNAVNIVQRVAMALVLLTTFLMIWANLAVGLIGSGPNPGNLMYMGVVIVAIASTIRSHFTPAGIERAMYAIVLALLLHTGIAFIIKLHELPQSSTQEILMVNGFFSGLYLIAASLFHIAGKEKMATV